MRKHSTLAALFTVLFFTQASFASIVLPKYATTTKRLSADHEYIQDNKAYDYWALSPYYVSQRDGKSCSLASASVLLNALKANQTLTASDELVTQDSLFKKTNNPIWKKGLGSLGRGVTLDELGAILEKTLPLYGIKATVQVFHVDTQSKEEVEKIKKILKENESSAEDFILSNFLQSEYTGDPEGKVGHISPIAAYDSSDEKVLIMDVDRQYYEPYWVSLETFVKGMNTQDDGAKKFRGFVWVKKIK